LSLGAMARRCRPCRTAPSSKGRSGWRVALVRLPTTLAGRCGLPGHRGIEPDRQRVAALQRFVMGGPVPGLAGRGCGSAHESQIPSWIHKMNPSQDLCNGARDTDRRLCSDALPVHPPYQADVKPDRPLRGSDHSATGSNGWTGAGSRSATTDVRASSYEPSLSPQSKRKKGPTDRKP
jgi:hypothetical protein